MRRYTWKTGLLESFVVLVALVFAVPIYILVNTAFKPAGQGGSAMALATSPTFENFIAAWNQGGLGGAIVNNVIITVCSVTLIVVLSASAAYPLARITRRWSKVAFSFFVGGLLVPGLLAMIPLYTTFRDMGLIGSIWALVIIYVGAQMPFSIFLYVQFLKSVPLDYEEAAALDGCSAFKGFWLVVFPLLRPITGTVVILNAISVWNDFFTPLLYLGGTQQQTIPVAIYSFTGQYVSKWNLVFAALVIGITPILVFYFLLQRNIIKGFAGGLKG